MQNEEFVEELHFVVACGHIESVAAIPTDWNVNIVRMTSGVEELHASAGHGASRLRSLGQFNGGVRVVPLETQCFDVTAKLLTSGGKDREIRLTRKELKLLP